MSDEMPEPTTFWVEQLKAGNPQAHREVCDRFWRLVVHQARQRLQGKAIVSDEEDVAISVFDTVFRRTAEGEYAEVTDGNDLRNLFLAITRITSLEHLRNASRQKRGGDVAKVPVPDELKSSQPDPTLEVEWQDRRDWLLEKLDENLREVALRRLEGLEIKEITAKLDMPKRSVERKLQLIREQWNHLVDNHGEEK